MALNKRQPQAYDFSAFSRPGKRKLCPATRHGLEQCHLDNALSDTTASSFTRQTLHPCLHTRVELCKRGLGALCTTTAIDGATRAHRGGWSLHN